MIETTMVRQDALPQDMRILLRDYPRDAWPDHPNFAASIQNWMGAHEMFRALSKAVRLNTEGYIDKSIGSDTYAARLSHYGNLLVRNLHGHHGWEDHVFFPEISRSDPRFDSGLATLESDHEHLDKVLERFTVASNRTVKLIQLDETQAQSEAGGIHKAASEIEGFLRRHLADEEDLVVPIILHHKLRG